MLGYERYFADYCVELVKSGQFRTFAGFLGGLVANGRKGAILSLVLGEALLIAVLGGGLGLLAAWLVVQRGDPTGGMLPIFILPARNVAAGAALIVALGLLAGLMPAITAMRLKITDALRRT